MRERPEDLFQQYGISAKNGFLPASTPLHLLPDPYYTPWEALLTDLPALVERQKIRSKIASLPILETKFLRSEQEWQRAYVILGYLTHAYIWGGDQPSETLPPPLACPFLKVSDHVGLPPTATYATLVLWNYTLKEQCCDLTEPVALRSLQTITGTRDEEWFYLISVAVEAKGAPLILTMLGCMQAVLNNDVDTVISCLDSTTAGIKELGALLARMHEHCDPQVFYHNIRPLLAGSKGMAAAGLTRGVFYDKGNGEGEWKQYSGGSNAQSSLIQFFDIFLQVDHHATGGPESGSKSTPSTRNVNGFIQEMRTYMPRAHREFLAHISSITNVRDYALSPTAPVEVQAAYNNAVAALVSFRNIHIQIVARYIVNPSRNPPANYIVPRKGLNLATISSTYQVPGIEKETGKQDLHGTGGTMLMPFLKKTRDETRDATMSLAN